MIVNPKTLTFADKKIRMLIAGYPGIGKTTLALSAPKPLYIDVDLSAERINRDVLDMAEGITQPRDYRELKKDLGLDSTDMELPAVKAALEPYETIVIDTGGKLLTIMGQYGGTINPKYRRTDGSLSLQGYGWLGKEFQRFMDHCIYQLDKHIVIVFHAVEDKDGDETRLRIKAEGSSKNSVWEVMDLGGFMEMRGNNRVIGFSNCERYFAKGTRGIHGLRPIPELVPGRPNDFLSRLFAEYNQISANEAEENAKKKAAYDAAMAEAMEIIGGVADAETANAAMPKMKGITHALTSETEISRMWNERIKSLGLMYDRVLKAYTAAPTEDTKGAK